jgi:thiamine-monophosphate kinase
MPAHRSEQTLADLGEDALVDRLAGMLPGGRDLVVGPGDDCAAVRVPGVGNNLLLLKTDCVVEGVHYLPDDAPGKVGHKAIARALSDVAAMGGRPAHALVTLVLPPTRTVAYARALYRGLAKTATAYGVTVAGGETARPAPGGTGMISVALTGHVARAQICLRSGGRPGDRLFVTGKLGGSIKGRHLTFQPRIAEAQWLVEHAKPSAMMDLSDGLGTDLPRLAKASSCGWEIHPDALPRHRGCDITAALGDGEDYELLFAIPRRRSAELETRWSKRFPNTPLNAIGHLREADTALPSLGAGWVHF